MQVQVQVQVQVQAPNQPQSSITSARLAESHHLHQQAYRLGGGFRGSSDSPT